MQAHLRQVLVELRHQALHALQGIKALGDKGDLHLWEAQLDLDLQGTHMLEIKVEVQVPALAAVFVGVVLGA